MAAALVIAPAELVTTCPATTPGDSFTLNVAWILPPGGRVQPGNDHDSLQTRLGSVHPGGAPASPPFTAV